MVSSTFKISTCEKSVKCSFLFLGLDFLLFSLLCLKCECRSLLLGLLILRFNLFRLINQILFFFLVKRLMLPLLQSISLESGKSNLFFKRSLFPLELSLGCKSPNFIRLSFLCFLFNLLSFYLQLCFFPLPFIINFIL